jgi:AcrR family transcriptional regulator
MVDIPKASWRQRVRDIATRDILRTARQLLADGGTEVLTVRAVARELGMSSQAMYRYYDSHDSMMEAVVLDILSEIAEYLETTANFADDEEARRPAASIVRISRALRQWAIEHPNEFQVIMVTPPKADTQDAELQNARYRFGRVFARLIAQHWLESGKPDWASDGVPPMMGAAVMEFRQRIDVPIPDEIIAVFLRCWVRLYGVICMEAMGQLGFLGQESGSFFEAELRDLADWLGFPATALVTASPSPAGA